MIRITLLSFILANLAFADQSDMLHAQLSSSIAGQDDLLASEIIKLMQGGDAVQSIQSAGDISYGSEVVFNPAHSTYVATARLDNNHFVVAYSDYGGSASYGTAVVGTVSGKSISYDAQSVFNSASSTYISIAALDNAHFVITYRDDGNSHYGTAIIGTVSEGIISFGSEVVFNYSTENTSVTSLSGSQFIIAYKDDGNSDYGVAIAGTVSGSTITFGSEFTFNTATTDYLSATSLDNSKFIVAYRDAGSSYYGMARVGTVSGSNIAFGSEYTFNSANSLEISAASLDASHFIVAYRDYGNASYGTVRIGTVSGSNIAYGSESLFNSARTEALTATSLNDSKVIVAFRDYSNSDYGTCVLGTLSGGAFSFGSKFVFNSASESYLTAARLDSGHFVVGYMDYGNSYYGTSIAGEIEGMADNSLPVELVSFTASVISSSVELHWEVASEIENLGFRLMKCTGQADFEEISSYTYDPALQGRGNATDAGQYRFTDRDVTPGNTYTYKLIDIDYSGVATEHAPLSITLPAEEQAILPDRFMLAQNYPNPFNPSTTLRYGIPRKQTVRLLIYDIHGHIVKTIDSENQPAGWHEYVWHGRDESGRQVPTGLYLARIETRSCTQVIKMLYLR